MAFRKEVERIFGMGPKTWEGLSRQSEEKELGRQVGLIEKHGVTVVSFKEEGYPKALLQTQEQPPMLFVRVRLLLEDELAVAVIGSRGPTVYGKQVAEMFGEGLAQRGVTVVSGMARGIDACAHRGALKAEGEDDRSSGLRSGPGLSTGAQETDGGDRPPRSCRLQNSHGGGAEGRTLFHPEPDHCRTISRGGLVVEPREDSGVFSNVNWALEQGKDVFAVPGPITSPVSRGGRTGLSSRGLAWWRVWKRS
jgi:DNA processing protein